MKDDEKLQEKIQVLVDAYFKKTKKSPKIKTIGYQVYVNNKPKYED